MKDAALLALARVLGDEACLVCGSSAQGKRANLIKQVHAGRCPICGALSLQEGDDVVPPNAVESERLATLLDRTRLARTEATNAPCPLGGPQP